VIKENNERNNKVTAFAKSLPSMSLILRGPSQKLQKHINSFWYESAKIRLMPGRLFLTAVTVSTSMHWFHTIHLFPVGESLRCVIHVAMDMLDVSGTAANVNGKVQIWTLSTNLLQSFFAMICL